MSNAARGSMLEARTVKRLVECGYHAERIGKRGRNRVADVFGCVDVLALASDGSIELIQVTTKGERSKRRRKIADAGLPHPVVLWCWFKLPNGRWDWISETVGPAGEVAA